MLHRSLAATLVLVAFVLGAAVPLRGQAAPDAPGALRRQVESWVAGHQRQIVTELLDLLAIPNVAADTANIRRNADDLRRMLATRGFHAELLETAGNPLVWGERKVPGAARTILILLPVRRPARESRGLEAARPVHPRPASEALPASGPDVADARTRETYGEDFRIYARSASDAKARSSPSWPRSTRCRRWGCSPRRTCE